MGSVSPPRRLTQARMLESLKSMLLMTRNPDGTPKDLDRVDVKIDGKIVAMVFSSGLTVYRVGVFTQIANLPKLEPGREQARMRAQLLADQVGGRIEWTKPPMRTQLTFFQAQLLGLPPNPPSMRYASSPPSSRSVAA
jgi:hypothetical protein